MKNLTVTTLLVLFACLLVGGTIRAQAPPPGPTVATSLSGIVEKIPDGLALRDLERTEI